MNRTAALFASCAWLSMMVLSSCRSPSTDAVEKSSGALANSAAVKSGNEQTDTPGDQSAFPVEASTPLRPAPMIQIQPSDLTTSIGKSPLRIGIDNLGQPVGTAVLQSISRVAHLYEWPEMNEVAVSFKTHDVAAQYGADGYRRAELAYVEVTPVSPLQDRWYALVLASIPQGVSLPRMAQHETIPGGSVGARFSPGSHPTVSSIRVCDKGSGTSLVTAEFSERVTADSSAQGFFQMGVAGQSVAGPSCIFEALTAADVGSAKFVRFNCQGLALDTIPMRVSFDANIKSPSGGALEAPGQGRGPLANVLSNSTMTDWGDGCRISRPW